MSHFLADIFNLFFPETCISCGEEIANKDQPLCLSCISDLTLCNFSSFSGNRLEKSFRGRIPVETATSLLYFHKKGMVQKLIHELKYNGKQYIGTYLGNRLADEMMLNKRFKDIDCIIPVPLHPDKERKRGYNQVATFAESLSKKLKIELYSDLLLKVSDDGTQTVKSRFQRARTGENKFVMNDKQKLIGRHVLVVDDIVTTGATMEACCASLYEIEGLRISLACMAFTD